jgi:predicted kinase
MRGTGRRLVLVSGAPGAGKTTLAGPLAAELGFALLSKDTIKETLHDQLGDVGDDELAWSRRLGAASMELLWTLASHAPAIVLEANFWPDDERVARRIGGLSAAVVEVYCRCPVPLAMSRYQRRAGGRHPAHAEARRVLTADDYARWSRPVGVGQLIIAGTTGPVDIAELALEVMARLGPVTADPAGSPGAGEVSGLAGASPS